MQDRKEYIKNSYSQYWISARKNIYGFMKYDKALIEFIKEKANPTDRVLEVAVGTGYPFADTLYKAGYDITGIDLSPQLIEECKSLNSDIDARVGDAEKLDFNNSVFNLTYCFHSSWYMPDLLKACSEMLRVTSEGGYIIFDIQNLSNDYIRKLYDRHIFYNTNYFGVILKTIRNIAKFTLRKGVQDWPLVVSETPTLPSEIVSFLESSLISEYGVYTRDINDELFLVKDKNNKFREYERLIFCVKKKKTTND